MKQSANRGSGFFWGLMLSGLVLGTGCVQKPILAPLPPPPPVPTPIPTPTPGPVCGFTYLGDIGCMKNGLTVIKSLADWNAYQALATCGTSVAGALSGFDFSTQMVINYDHYNCSEGYVSCGVSITNVCFYPDRIEVSVTQTCGDLIQLNPSLSLVVCNGSAVVVPQSNLPVVVDLCGQSGLAVPPYICP